MRWIVCVGLVGLLAGCQTPYQEMGFLGGVTATRITEDTAQISARGNAYTAPEIIQRYALRRAAEETVNDGYDLFRIGGTEDTTREGSQTFGTAYGNRYAIYGSSFSMPVIKPGQTLMIRMLKGPRPDPMPDGEYDAHEVLKFLTAADATSDHKNCVTQNGKVVCQ